MELTPHDRLCSWLGLPSGSWPPDHYALLGLTRGTGDVVDVEGRVLDRMELLRPHQLLHPELVTEGMNRLAQALVCLTDPIARTPYDRSLGIVASPFEVVEDEVDPFQVIIEPQPPSPTEVAFQPGLRPPGEPQQAVYEVVWEPESKPLPSRIPSYEVVPDKPAEKTLPGHELAAGEVAEVAELPQVAELPPAPISRRALYRRLAAIRKALRAWEGLRPVFATPTEALATPVAVLLFLQALIAVREALPGVTRVIQEITAPGGMVVTLVRMPHAIHTVRALVPSQRQTLALDWHHGYDTLRREHIRLRQMAFVSHPRRHSWVGLRLFRSLRRTPEWILLIVAIVVVLMMLLKHNS